MKVLHFLICLSLICAQSGDVMEDVDTNKSYCETYLSKTDDTEKNTYLKEEMLKWTLEGDL